MSRRGKKDEGGATNEDLEILRKEYRNMQANRNAFAHESDTVNLYDTDFATNTYVPLLSTLLIILSLFTQYIDTTEAAGYT